MQWKGPCLDFACDCGYESHVCGVEFLYYVRCPVCLRAYKCPTDLQLEPQRDEDIRGHFVRDMLESDHSQ